MAGGGSGGGGGGGGGKGLGKDILLGLLGMGAMKAMGGSGITGMKRGGRVKKTGPHLLHKGERVVPARKRPKRGRGKRR